MEHILFLVLIIYVKTQELPMGYRLPTKPDRCHKPAEFMYRQCCLFPPFFTGEVARACGATRAINGYNKNLNYTLFLRLPYTVCDHWKCILEKYGLLSPANFLDDIKYYEHLDRWVRLNPIFSNVLSNAKDYCKNVYRMELPLPVCSFFNIHMCIRNFIITDCPATFPTKECQEFRKFYEECREFFI